MLNYQRVGPKKSKKRPVSQIHLRVSKTPGHGFHDVSSALTGGSLQHGRPKPGGHDFWDAPLKTPQRNLGKMRDIPPIPKQSEATWLRPGRES